jgi:chromosome segregation ATPase
LRGIFARSWYLFIPLIAIWVFDARMVDPQIKAVEALIVEDQKTTETARSRSLQEARKMSTQISRLRAISDTIAVRIEQVAAFMDSVRVIQETHTAETQNLQRQTDSLRVILSEAEGRSLAASEELQVLQTQVDSLRSLISAHEQETTRLHQEIASAEDMTDRLLRPEIYRNNKALVTGEGQFPNRDALPKR